MLELVGKDTDDVHRQFFERLAAHIAERIPGFEVRYKDEDRGQKVLGALVRPVIKGYVTQYTTTLYPRVYFPTRRDVTASPRSAWKTLAHEYVHLWDTHRSRVLFPLSYVMPQALAVGALGAVTAWWNPLGWMAPLSLVALAPWPSPWRTQAELRGYAMDLAIKFWQTGRRPNPRPLVRLFTGWAYYRMCPDGAQVESMFAQVLDDLEQTGLPFTQDAEPFVEVRELMRRHWREQA